MADREYPFALPYTLESWALDLAVVELVRDHIWEALPGALQSKISEATVSKGTLVITKEDLDSIPDETWDAIKHLLPS